HSGGDQHPAGGCDQDLLGGGLRLPAADADRQHLRDEFRRDAGTALALGLSAGPCGDGGLGAGALSDIPVEEMALSDWNPAAYSAFRSLRLRPALDLLAQVPDLPPGDVVDLGCGDGAAAGALAARFPGRRLVGVDASPAMLEKAAGYAAKMQA